MRRLIDRYLEVNDATAAESRERVRAVFDEVGERLSDGRRFLVDDRFTAADLTFASLAAAVLDPVALRRAAAALEALSEPFAGEVRALREHPAGAFALRLYDQERPYTQRT